MTTDERIIGRIAKDLQISSTRTHKAVALLDEGNTVPFIARYRKAPVYSPYPHRA